jgi:NAD(P)-dependent dehydrogenase (short-subunit alcohol dehydrogenase family)
MDVHDRIVVVTGGGRGIGEALARQFQREGAAQVVVSDVDFYAAQDVADSIGGVAIGCDVSQEKEIRHLIDKTETEVGPIDIFCANAGVTVKGGLDLENGAWERLWNVNVMSRVWTAKHLVPRMIERGGGAFVTTASGAGVLTEVGSAPYSVTKHADVAFAEWLDVEYGRQGLHVSCICPLGVNTKFLDHEDPIHQYLADDAVTAERVAEVTIQAIRDEQFLVLPHERVADFIDLKWQDFYRYLRGMQRMKQKWQNRAA